MTKGASPVNKDESKISCQLAKIMCPHLQWLTIDTGSRPNVVYGLPFHSLNVKDPKKFVSTLLTMCWHRQGGLGSDRGMCRVVTPHQSLTSQYKPMIQHTTNLNELVLRF